MRGVDLIGLFVLIYGAACLVGFVRAARRPAPAESDLLGARPEGPLPDTALAFFVGAFAWWCLVTGATTFLAGTTFARLAGHAFEVELTAVINLGISLALLRAARSGTRRPTLPPGRRVGVGVRGGLAMYAVQVPVVLLIAAAYMATKRAAPQQDVVQMAREAQGGDVLVFLLGAVFIAPVAEEIFFRGIMLPAAANAFGPRLALVVQAAAFGAVHVVQSPVTWPLAIPLAVVGWFNGWLYLRTGDLTASVVAHATFNAVNFSALLLT